MKRRLCCVTAPLSALSSVSYIRSTTSPSLWKPLSLRVWTCNPSKTCFRLCSASLTSSGTPGAFGAGEAPRAILKPKTKVLKTKGSFYSANSQTLQDCASRRERRFVAALKVLMLFGFLAEAVFIYIHSIQKDLCFCKKICGFVSESPSMF